MRGGGEGGGKLPRSGYSPHGGSGGNCLGTVSYLPPLPVRRQLIVNIGIILMTCSVRNSINPRPAEPGYVLLLLTV